MSPDGYRVHVADIGLDPSKKEIEKHFERYGPLIEVWVARNPPCFAFVVFKYKDDAEASIRELDGKYVHVSVSDKCYKKSKVLTPNNDIVIILKFE